MKIPILGLLATLLILSCTKENTIIKSYPSIHIVSNKSVTLDTTQLKTWAYKDIMQDTIPGISLDRVYQELIADKVGDTVIVAVIDMEVDIEHEDLAHAIWQNPKEIPDNNRDDDGNGYTDDIHGWNFLGNLKEENNLFVNYEYTRILKKYDTVFKDKTIAEIAVQDTVAFNTYQRAAKKYEKRMEYALERKENYIGLENNYINAKKALSSYFPINDYTLEQLDSLKTMLKGDEEMDLHLLILSNCIKYKITKDWILDQKRKSSERVDKLLNKEYNDKVITSDDPDNLEDSKYGNPYVYKNADFLSHGTLVAGVVTADRGNNKGTHGITNTVKIMPLCISAYGDEHDKDMTLAIRYAVDNGAKIINISSSKEFSLHQDWVADAIRYASKNDVLIVTSAGNDGYDLDAPENYNYPDDTDLQGNEIVDTFIKVGSSCYQLNKIVNTNDSNYGKKKVDIFAPGEKIYTTEPSNIYDFHNGTSYATPMVSGVAALIRSYYPSLSAATVKDILMQSGTAYHINVEIEQEDGTKKLVPFSELSKSGRIVNAYHAMVLAEKMSKQ